MAMLAALQPAVSAALAQYRSLLRGLTPQQQRMFRDQMDQPEEEASDEQPPKRRRVR